MLVLKTWLRRANDHSAVGNFASRWNEIRANLGSVFGKRGQEFGQFLLLDPDQSGVVRELP